MCVCGGGGCLCMCISNFSGLLSLPKLFIYMPFKIPLQQKNISPLFIECMSVTRSVKVLYILVSFYEKKTIEQLSPFPSITFQKLPLGVCKER